MLLENGRGAILAAVHSGNWELLGGSCFGRVSIDFCGHETEW